MKVLVADDHPMMREALCLTVLRADPQAEIVEASDFDAAERACEAAAPDLALLDLNMPGMHGLDGVRRLHARFPAIALVVASARDDAPTIRAALDIGARGYVPKTIEPALLLQALRLVMAGGVFVPAGVLDNPGRHAGSDRADAPRLTPRQLAVLQRLAIGESNKLIARGLGLSEGTVKIHVAAILRCLRANNRTEAVVRARTLGIGGTDPG